MKPHPEFTNYIISEDGHVFRNGKQLKEWLFGKGYLKVWLSKNGKKSGKSVHRIVAETYIPNPGRKPQVNHKDTNKQNNHKDNLEWSTGLENAKHATDSGLYDRKITTETVLKIRELSATKTNGELCKIFNLSSGYISQIVGRTRRGTI